jgi:hypothetical protein
MMHRVPIRKSGERARAPASQQQQQQHQQKHQPAVVVIRPPSSSPLLARGGAGAAAPRAAASPSRGRPVVAAAAAAASAAQAPPQQHDPPLLLADPCTLAAVRDRLLRDELPRLFDPSAREPLSPDLYAEHVVFQDPLASIAGFPLYRLNVLAIRAVFDVSLVTHAAVVRERESAVVTRWTMTLAPKGVPEGGLPFLTGRVRRPSLAVTGASAYGVDRATGRVVSHVDTWDSVPMRRQPDALLRGARAPIGASALGGDGAVGSGDGEDGDDDDRSGSSTPRALLLPPRPRGLLDVARRALRAALALTPDLATPRYDVLVAAPRYEVRRYASFALAETDMRSDGPLSSLLSLGGGGDGRGPTVAGGDGFNQLAGFIFGGNEEGRKWDMTTPVLSDAGAGASGSGGQGAADKPAAPTMAFVLDGEEEGGQEEEERGEGEGEKRRAAGGGQKGGARPAAFATPKDPAVRTRVEPGGRLWASISVPGWALQRDVTRAERALRAALARDGVARAVTPPGQYRLLRYNDPLTPPQLRRNEVLVAVEFCAGGGGGAAGGGDGDADSAWAEALLAERGA